MRWLERTETRVLLRKPSSFTDFFPLSPLKGEIGRGTEGGIQEASFMNELDHIALCDIVGNFAIVAHDNHTPDGGERLDEIGEGGGGLECDKGIATRKV